ncbi:MAG: DUF2269 domain-containing protein, partial [Acidimicrobiales bacterium]|nr:DUF2269 domain-containing protein [Acidimicrobiales bacterium]
TALSLSIPIGVVSALTGIVLSAGTRWGFARYWWVLLKEVITAAVLLTDPLVVLPAVRRALDGGGSELIGPLTAHVVMLAVATVLSVVKPFGRRGARGRTA